VARIGIFGAGYVGLVTGACFADLGHDVVIRDVLPERVESLRRGEVPIHEPGLAPIIKRNIKNGRLSFTLDVKDVVKGAKFLYLAVPTPQGKSGAADMSAVWKVIEELPPSLPGRPIVVMKSTVPVGTGAAVRAALDKRGLKNVGYASNPEFLAEGTAVRDSKKPDRVVVGAFVPKDADRVADLYAGLKTTIVKMDVASAELVKLAANAMLSTRISFINEIANLSELVGADVKAVAEGVGLDDRIGPRFLQAGIGYGGSCFPKDTRSLVHVAKEAGYDLKIVPAAIRVNELQKGRAVEKLERHLGELSGKRIALLGLAFKADTDDTREATSRVLAKQLIKAGAEVRGWDPKAQLHDVPAVAMCETPLEAVTGADAAVIVTEWTQLLDFPTAKARKAMRRPLIIDGRNLLDPAKARKLGFEYEGTGRAVTA
jgi:UDPglucose 6-dehydrogenase